VRVERVTWISASILCGGVGSSSQTRSSGSSACASLIASLFLRADDAVVGLDPLATRIGVVGDVERVGIGVVEVELDGGEAIGDDFLGAAGIFLRLVRIALVAIGIDADFLAKAAAEEGGDRQFVGAAHQVPERYLDAGHGGDGRAALRTFAGKHAVDDEHQLGDVGRVLADDVGRSAMYQFGNTGAPIRLTKAGNTLVGFNSDQHPGKVAVDDGGAHARDFHSGSFLKGNGSAGRIQAVARAISVAPSNRWILSWSNSIQTFWSGSTMTLGSRLTMTTEAPRKTWTKVMSPVGSTV
jgi:hypothetical protein